MLDPNQIRASMKIPPQLKEAYLRIVSAGMKVMFSDKTSGMMVQQLKSSPDMVKNLSEGIAGLMAILFKQSKNMPQNLILPAALELLTHAMDFVAKTKMAQLTPKQIGDATQATVYAVLAKFGITQTQADQMLAQMGQKAQGGAQAPAAQTAPQAGGIINQGMAQ